MPMGTLFNIPLILIFEFTLIYCYMCHLYLKLRVILKREKVSQNMLFSLYIYNIDYKVTD